ncbi:PREDICTED: CD226 antigen isoform X2 [Chinchilla lanigera]|uniref:CD226 molecule n=1 Tax=Chinchilla lanigera TaxID=34839 RepID=A0A8C2VBZ3_CHILA|nr:PREDICTED: CD226 antigen isoform X2 [Chinchilla lanigera]
MQVIFFNRAAPKSFPQMDCLAFLLVILQAYKALCEETFWDTTVRLAESMTLECVYPLMDEVTQAEWFKTVGEQKQSMAIFNPDHGVAIRKPYENKVHFLNSTKARKDVTLSFHNASDTDVGSYSCLIHTFPSGPWEKTVQVVQTDSFEIQLRKHSHMVVSPGNVKLSFKLHMNWSAQQITWEKIQPHQIDLLTHCNLSRGKSFSKYRKQMLTNCTQGIRSSFIIIPNATASDSGLYRCCFISSTGQNETFLIRLTITDGETHNQYIIAAVLLFLFVILIVTIVIYYNKRRRRKKNVPAKNSSDTQSKVGNNYRRPISTHQPVGDANEDIYVNYPSFARRPKPRF